MDGKQSELISKQASITEKENLIQQILEHKRKWLAIGHGIYKQQTYQYVYRPTVKQSHEPNTKKTNDGIQIVPVIQYTDHKQIVFIANFRPAVGKFVIEFPAGLAQGEDMFQNARRQLEEETGLVPYKFVSMPTPITYADPHKGNQSGIFYIALVDGSKQQSFVPFKREHTENIRCYSMKYNKETGICEVLLKFAQEHDYIMEAKTWLVCMTVDLVDKLKTLNIIL